MDRRAGVLLVRVLAGGITNERLLVACVVSSAAHQHVLSGSGHPRKRPPYPRKRFWLRVELSTIPGASSIGAKRDLPNKSRSRPGKATNLMLPGRKPRVVNGPRKPGTDLNLLEPHQMDLACLVLHHAVVELVHSAGNKIGSLVRRSQHDQPLYPFHRIHAVPPREDRASREPISARQKSAVELDCN